MRLPDPVALVKRQPLIAVGAVVAAIAGVQLLRGAGDVADVTEDGAAIDPAAPGTGGLLGMGLGSIPAPVGFATNGELVDSGTVSTPAPAPTPAPTPAAKVPYLYATVRSGTHDRYDLAKLSSGKQCSQISGTYKTGGYSAEVRDLGTTPHCNAPSKTRRLLLVLTGTHAGKIINRSTATVSTKYR